MDVSTWLWEQRAGVETARLVDALRHAFGGTIIGQRQQRARQVQIAGSDRRIPIVVTAQVGAILVRADGAVAEIGVVQVGFEALILHPEGVAGNGPRIFVRGNVLLLDLDPGYPKGFGFVCLAGVVGGGRTDEAL